MSGRASSSPPRSWRVPPAARRTVPPVEASGGDERAGPARERPSPPPAVGPRSLTARLVSGVVVLVVVLVCAIGTITYSALRSFLFDRLDQQVAPVAAANQDEPRATCLRFEVPTMPHR